MSPEDYATFEEELFSPSLMIGIGRDPDAVSQAIIDEEMSLFGAFSRENVALGG